eukprot:TRINITY_DN28230_c0_g1_i2.p1 TRINITY_DN28230_c0_g1~~TRINITY_DN28230_c0_g1_i2.p1  ORF type:complete len:281 (-),score=78.08 TRINITY_DN28230_c0_g1_i2:112-930(-)
MDAEMSSEKKDARMLEYEEQAEQFFERVQQAFLNNLEIGLDAYSRSLGRGGSAHQDQPLHQELSQKDQMMLQQLREAAIKRFNKYFPTFKQFVKERLMMPSPALEEAFFEILDGLNEPPVNLESLSEQIEAIDEEIEQVTQEIHAARVRNEVISSYQSKVASLEEYQENLKPRFQQVEQSIREIVQLNRDLTVKIEAVEGGRKRKHPRHEGFEEEGAAQNNNRQQQEDIHGFAAGIDAIFSKTTKNKDNSSASCIDDDALQVMLDRLGPADL